MVVISFHPDFQKTFSKINHALIKEKIIKQIAKLKEQPELGKPMRFDRKGMRELYIAPYRLSYIFIKEEDKIVILALYHKDDQ